MNFNYHLVKGSALIAKGVKLLCTRKKAYTFEMGRPVSSGMDKFNFVGNVQPLSGTELLRLEEGQRSREFFNIFTIFQITLKDLVMYNGAQYEVDQVEAWQSYYKGRMVRVDVEPS